MSVATGTFETRFSAGKLVAANEDVCCFSDLAAWVVFLLATAKERGCLFTLASLIFFNPTGMCFRAAKSAVYINI